MLTYVVTGANRGLGFGFARQLAEEGNKVFATARDVESAADLAALPGVTVVQLETTDPESCKKAAQTVAELCGGAVDVLIANAGYNGVGAFYELGTFPSDAVLMAEVESAYKTNVLGNILTINAFLPLVQRGRKKTVVALSSGMADLKFQEDLGYSGNAVYGASKAALNYVIGKYAIRHKDEGMIFVALCPGWVRTSGPEDEPYSKEALAPFIKMLQQVEPTCSGPKSLRNGTDACLNVIKRLTVEHNGQLLSYHGDKKWV
ncbi:NADP-binding protein [Dacryopinax primogenitus]|uniref:NADP-binding protein n=1 Tax=Dacryopinax primogenitus (strain DJM 731) TaxID=1858805 RepID=M5FQP1_DACPD|nr:NADP-binding protein [Dacryopinax primogenitus]EJT97079.1 NADP-binding protein [Dacryopinax primogenitus]